MQSTAVCYRLKQLHHFKVSYFSHLVSYSMGFLKRLTSAKRLNDPGGKPTTKAPDSPLGYSPPGGLPPSSSGYPVLGTPYYPGTLGYYPQYGQPYEPPRLKDNDFKRIWVKVPPPPPGTDVEIMDAPLMWGGLAPRRGDRRTEESESGASGLSRYVTPPSRLGSVELGSHEAEDRDYVPVADLTFPPMPKAFRRSRKTKDIFRRFRGSSSETSRTEHSEVASETATMPRYREALLHPPRREPSQMSQVPVLPTQSPLIVETTQSEHRREISESSQLTCVKHHDFYAEGIPLPRDVEALRAQSRRERSEESQNSQPIEERTGRRPDGQLLHTRDREYQPNPQGASALSKASGRPSETHLHDDLTGHDQWANMIALPANSKVEKYNPLREMNRRFVVSDEPERPSIRVVALPANAKVAGDPQDLGLTGPPGASDGPPLRVVQLPKDLKVEYFEQRMVPKHGKNCLVMRYDRASLQRDLLLIVFWGCSFVHTSADTSV